MKKVAGSLLLAATPGSLIYLFSCDIMNHSDVRQFAAWAAGIMIMFNLIYGLVLLFGHDDSNAS